MSSEQLAQQRVTTAGYQPLEPYPGKVNLRWRLKCVECGEEANLRPTPKLRPCEHKEREQQQQAEKAAEQSYHDALRAVRLRTLGSKNLLPLEPFPGEGQRWWVQCRYCSRNWHMPEDTLRACPHKGTGDPGR